MTISLQFRAAIGVDNIDYWSIIDLLTQIVNKFPNSANTTTILTVTTTILTVFASTFLVIIFVTLQAGLEKEAGASWAMRSSCHGWEWAIISNEWGNHFKWVRKQFVHFFSLFRLIPTIPTTTATQPSPKALRQMEPREPSSSTPWYRNFCWNGAVQQWHSQVPEMSEEDIRKAVEPLLLEYFDNGDCDEVFIGWHELQITLLFQVLNTLEEMLLNIGTRRWRSLWQGK